MLRESIRYAKKGKVRTKIENDNLEQTIARQASKVENKWWLENLFNKFVQRKAEMNWFFIGEEVDTNFSEKNLVS